MHDGVPPTDDGEPPLADNGGVGQRAQASSPAIIVQAARDATISLTHDLVLPDGQVRLVQAQAETIQAQRQLIAVMEELNDARRMMLESAQVEHRASQVILVLRVVLIRLSALISQLTGERDRYLAEIADHRTELTATRRRLSTAEQERGRAEGQLGQAQEERRRATALAEGAQAKILELENSLRRVGLHDPGLPTVGAEPDSAIPSHDDVLGDTAAGLDRVQRFLDEQERELADLEAGGAGVVLSSRVLDLDWFLDRLAGVLTGSVTRVGLCHLELDGPVAFNDTLGEREYQVLAVARARLARVLPDSGFLTVLGTGFVIAVAEPRDDVELIELTRRLLAEVAAPIPVDEVVLTLPAAAGIVMRETARSIVSELLRDARAALDAAKRRGPNQWVVFTPHRMDDPARLMTDVLSLSPVGMGLFDEADRLVDANDALCDLLGLELEQLRGMTAEQLTHPDDDGRWLRAARETGDPAHEVPQRILVRSDGGIVYCELRITLSRERDGGPTWLVAFQDVTERRRTAEALRHQATHDELTGLPNRALVKEMLTTLLDSEDRSRVAVLFCDVDNFKRVNDSLGHDAGDELLVALARRLEAALPEGCTAARLSGDEYVIICSDIDEVGGVDALAARVAGVLRTAVPVHGQLVRVSASIGAAVPHDSQVTGNDLLRFADAAMFEAKRFGAGRVSLASAGLIASADRQVHLEGQLREALAHDGLALHFQPVVGVDGSVQAAEAFVRWPHPDRGLLSPDVFLPVAEQGDLLRELDRWVLRRALKEAVTWPAPNDQPVSVAVNLAGLVPGDPEFVDIVADAIDEAGIPWDRVVLELVETALVGLPSRVRQSMGELVDRGIRFAVDDFGTGYSSLARLRDLPAQIIKVDRWFVSDVGNDSSDFAVARAVVAMTRAMGRKCVAEAVETVAQFTALRDLGVDAYQGWLFSPPVPAEEIRAVLATSPLPVPALD
ncbi:putative bifunctional diguanylate cyclase/phosphodiesterase [Saccharothrix sp. NRRL B-16348]|uniref:putative bifunctional diguanylate cyclase/phosphodiesterase n=1 Tax=Saccharothrix sp. NRRL B-16348 TaxID=1415542 RepID=UPI000A75CDE5|nr:EAL domain-containing protein [Saccharothrix sp. NRRL B-16348]